MLKTFFIDPEFNLLISLISQIQHTTYPRAMADGFHLFQNHWLGLLLPIRGVKNTYDNGDCVKSISIKALVNLRFIKGYFGVAEVALG